MTSYVWEPWQPAVGDRVRVRLSGECRWDRDGIAQDDPGHDEEMLDGLLGTVTKHVPNVWKDGHHYRVEFEVCPCGLATPDDPCYEWLAAIELERQEVSAA